MVKEEIPSTNDTHTESNTHEMSCSTISLFIFFTDMFDSGGDVLKDVVAKKFYTILIDVV